MPLRFSVGGLSRAQSPERAQVLLDAICFEDLRVDAILRAKQRDLQLVNKHLQSLDAGRDAEEDRP